MDKKRALQLIPFIQAFAEGKTVQGLYAPNPDVWIDLTIGSFHTGMDYRIKPEPRVIYVVEAELDFEEDSCREATISDVKIDPTDRKFIEVLDE